MSRSIAERLMSEATGVTLPNTMQTYSKPKMTGGHCKLPNSAEWETSFMQVMFTICYYFIYYYLFLQC